MATSGSKTVAIFANWLHLEFSWWQTGQSVANNTTTIGWKMDLISGNGTLTRKDRDWSVTVDGQKYSSKVRVNIAANSRQTLASGTTTIAHNDDGTKTFSYSFSQSFNLTLNNGSYMGSYSGSGSDTLTTIARASQPSLVTWPETTNNVGDFGATFSIHMNRKSSTFLHTVRYEYGSRSGTIATNVENGTTWAVPRDFMNDIPNATEASGRIYVDTYSNGVLVGTKYTGYTVTVPANAVPRCSVTLEDTSGVDDIYGSPVQGLSTIKITVKGTPSYSSPIKTYSITVDGVAYSSASATTAPLRLAGMSAVVARVTDGRGRSGLARTTMDVQAYTPPVISALAVHRCDADGTENDQGEYVKVTFDAAISSLNSKNTATYTLRYKKTDASSYTEVALSDLTNVYTVSGGSVIFAADGNSSYTVEIVAADRHHTVPRQTSASTAFTLMNWGADGTSMALGKVAEEEHTLEVALDNHFYGHTQQEGNRYAFSSPGVAGTGGFVLMARVQIIAANADTPITFVFSQRQAVAPMTAHLQLRNSTATDSSLGSFRYEGANYGAYAYQSDPLTWDIYVLKGSNYDTITLQDWYTSATMNSRVKVSFPGELVDAVPQPYYRATPAQLESLLDYIYPVGSIYLSYSHNNPATMFGGTWVRIEDTFLWATGATGTIGLTGGSKTHTLTVDELPAHSHGSVYSQHAEGTKNLAWYSASGDKIAYGAVTAGGGEAHNNMPPYVQISAWRRTA